MLRVALFLCVLTLGADRAGAFDKFAEPRDESTSFQTQVLLSGLDNPTGIALRPAQGKSGPYELLFAESGAGRVLRISTRQPEQVEEVVTGLTVGQLGAKSQLNAGAIALGFITRTKLAVTTIATADVPGQVASYVARPGSAALMAGQVDHVVGLPSPNFGEDSQLIGFGGIAVSGRSCFVTSIADGGIVQVYQGMIEANQLRNLQRLSEVQSENATETPLGLTVIPPPRPAFLVAGLPGVSEAGTDSRIVYYVPATGEEALNLPTGLSDIVNLAYSPSGQLYAADFSWSDPQAGGIFRLDDALVDGKQTCRAVKIATVVRPYGLTFAPDGTLFVTAFGAGDNEKQGELLLITGDL